MVPATVELKDHVWDNQQDEKLVSEMVVRLVIAMVVGRG